MYKVKYTHGMRGTFLAWYVEKNKIFSSYYVTNTISIIGNRTKSTTSRYAIGKFPQVKLISLSVRCLWRRQSPWFTQYFLYVNNNIICKSKLIFFLIVNKKISFSFSWYNNILWLYHIQETKITSCVFHYNYI